MCFVEISGLHFVLSLTFKYCLFAFLLSSIGEWIDGKEHGKGIMRYEDGDVYEGVWARGKRLDTAKVTALGEDILQNISKANQKITDVSKQVNKATMSVMKKSSANYTEEAGGSDDDDDC
jgi:hypothetical protein